MRGGKVVEKGGAGGGPPQIPPAASCHFTRMASHGIAPIGGGIPLRRKLPPDDRSRRGIPPGRPLAAGWPLVARWPWLAVQSIPAIQASLARKPRSTLRPFERGPRLPAQAVKLNAPLLDRAPVDEVDDRLGVSRSPDGDEQRE